MDAPSRREARVLEVVLGILTIVSLFPFWAGALVLSVDFPQHLAIAAIASELDDPARRLSEFYRVDLWPRPYVLTTYLLQALGAWMPLERAGRALLSAYAVALILAARALIASAEGRDRRLAVFAPLFVSSWAVGYGFLPYVSALPLVLWALATARRLQGAPSVARAAALAASCAGTLLFHPVAAVILAVAGLPLAWTAPSGRPRRLIVLGAIAGFAAVVGVAALGDARASLDAASRFNDGEIENQLRLGIKHKLLDYALTYFPGDLDVAFAAPGALALLVAIGVGLWRGRGATRVEPLEWSLLALGLVYLVTPADLALGPLRASLLGQRLVVPLWLLALAAPRGRVPSGLVAVGAASSAAFTFFVAVEAIEFGKRWGPGVERAAAAVPVGARVLPEVAPPETPALHARVVSTPERSLHAYVMLRGAAYDPEIFSTRQSPVRLRADAPLPSERTQFDQIWSQGPSPPVALLPAP